MLGRFLDRAALPLDLFPISQSPGNNEHPMVYHGLTWFIMVYHNLSRMDKYLGPNLREKGLLHWREHLKMTMDFPSEVNLHLELGSFYGIS